jgi:hypothetical protein
MNTNAAFAVDSFLKMRKTTSFHQDVLAEPWARFLSYLALNLFGEECPPKTTGMATGLQTL